MKAKGASGHARGSSVVRPAHRAELLTYNGLLVGLPAPVVEARAGELLGGPGAGRGGRDPGGRLLPHGTRKKIALASALLHAPGCSFLDELFEAIDLVSARPSRGLLERYTAGGATVVFSSHVMDLVQMGAIPGRSCTRRLITEGPTDQVRAGRSLEDAFVELVGAAGAEELGLATWSA